MTLVEQHATHPSHQGPPPPPRGWRRLLYPGFVRAAWMAPLFFGIGSGIVVRCRWWGSWHPIWFGEVIVLVGALTAGPIGFLAGIGAFDYWVRYAIGAPTQPEDHSGHGAYSWRDYFRVNTDHKVIGIQYLTTTIFFFLAGGLLAMRVRLGLDGLRTALGAPAARHDLLQHGRPVGGGELDHDRAQLPGHDHHHARSGDDLLAHAASRLGELHHVTAGRDRHALHRGVAVLRHVRPGNAHALLRHR